MTSRTISKIKKIYTLVCVCVFNFDTCDKTWTYQSIQEFITQVETEEHTHIAPLRGDVCEEVSRGCHPFRQARHTHSQPLHIMLKHYIRTDHYHTDRKP